MNIHISLSILAIIFGVHTVVFGENESDLAPLVLQKLLKPDDTAFEKEAKTLIAEYLLAIAEQSENSKKSQPTVYSAFNNNSPVAIGRQDVVATEVPATAPAVTPAPVAAVTSAPASSNAATQASTGILAAIGITARPRPSNAHILGQVDKILQNVYQGNVSGIIDQSLGIRDNTPVRNLVNGIIGLVFCTPWDRFLGTCNRAGAAVAAPQAPAAAASPQVKRFY